MVGQFCDDFGSYGPSVNDRTFISDGTPWIIGINPTTFADPDPNAPLGSRCLALSTIGENDSATDSRLSVPIPRAKIFSCARYWLTNLPANTSGNPQLIAFRAPDNNKLISLVVEPNGALSIYRNSTNTKLATTTNPVIASQRWAHVAMSYSCSTGAYEVQLEGRSLAALTGTDPSPAGGLIGIICYSPRTQFNPQLGVFMKDLCLWDSTGSTNNSFLGTVSVYRLPVDGDVSSGWTPSTGSDQYTLLDEAPPNDANYISADDAPPSPAIFSFKNLPPEIVGVRWLMPYLRMRKNDGGDASIQASLTSGGSSFDGADRPVTTAFSYWFDISDVDPDTAAPWTPSAVDDAEIQINRTT